MFTAHSHFLFSDAAGCQNVNSKQVLNVNFNSKPFSSCSTCLHVSIHTLQTAITAQLHPVGKIVLINYTSLHVKSELPGTKRV